MAAWGWGVFFFGESVRLSGMDGSYDITGFILYSCLLLFGFFYINVLCMAGTDWTGRFF